jgi:hypothetical protein
MRRFLDAAKMISTKLSASSVELLMPSALSSNISSLQCVSKIHMRGFNLALSDLKSISQ